jgi:hypothetical protein
LEVWVLEVGGEWFYAAPAAMGENGFKYDGPGFAAKKFPPARDEFPVIVLLPGLIAVMLKREKVFAVTY